MKINYQKHYGSDGCVYTQTITINNTLKKAYNDMLQKEYNRIQEKQDKDHVTSDNDMEILCYTKKLEKWVNYLHITWLYCFYSMLQKKWIKENRLKLFRNTIIEVL